MCHSSWALGVGRRLLDELSRYAVARAGRTGQIADSDAFHTDFARAEAKFRAAAALVRETWDDVERTLDSGRTLDVRQETMVRLALNHITSTITEGPQSLRECGRELAGLAAGESWALFGLEP
ncbi:acyl-CoA dehydrogenase family protein [Nonomuraea angiospora]|nr:acyl-CoA dehydrogenase family protein [Nonomuraea angiospora]